MTSQPWCHRHKNSSICHQLNSLQNLYFQIFIFWILTEWCRFVTYLCNDPRTIILLFCVLLFLILKKCHGRQSSFCCPSVFKMTYDVSNGMLSPIVPYQLRTYWVHFRLNSLAFVQKPTSFLILTQQLWFLVFQVDWFLFSVCLLYSRLTSFPVKPVTSCWCCCLLKTSLRVFWIFFVFWCHNVASQLYIYLCLNSVGTIYTICVENVAKHQRSNLLLSVVYVDCHGA